MQALKNYMKVLIGVAGYIFCGIGNPLIFWLIVGALLKNEAFFIPKGAAVYQLNLPIYILCSLSLYGIWLGIQFGLSKSYRSERFSLKIFFDRKFTPFYLLLSSFGNLNILMWSFEMEMNVFGFIFAIPFLVLNLLMIVMELRFFVQAEPIESA